MIVNDKLEKILRERLVSSKHSSVLEVLSRSVIELFALADVVK
jgi:hypothetical protein